MSTISIFLSAILAGLSISIGGCVFLLLESKVLGALFFTIGLFVICTFKLHLFTGKVCYVFRNDKKYALSLPVIWLGNLCGTFIGAMLQKCTRVDTTITEKAATICQTKLNDSLLSIFILAIFCNILIYIAVEGFNSNPHEVGKYLSLFFGVVVFILCGFEHCVANMYYFTVAGAWSLKTVLYVLVMTAGNAVGGVSYPLIRDYIAKKNG